MAFEFLNDMFDKIKKMLEPGNNDEDKLAPGTTRRLSGSSKNGGLSAKNTSASKPAANSQKGSSTNKTNVDSSKLTLDEKSGMQLLEDLLDPTKLKASVVFLKSKNPKIEQFVENYKKEVLKFGRIYEGIFSEYPSDIELEKALNHFRGLHILEFDSYKFGVSRWLPSLSVEQGEYIARKAFGVLVNAGSEFGREQGNNKLGGNISQANAIICTWMKESIDVFENLKRVLEEKHTQKIYYKGPIKAVALYYFIFLSAFGCDVVVDLDPSQEEPLTWVSQLPENMRVIEIV